MKNLLFMSLMLFFSLVAVAQETTSKEFPLETIGKELVAQLNEENLTYFDEVFDKDAFVENIKKSLFDILGNEKENQKELDEIVSKKLHTLALQLKQNSFGEQLLGPFRERGAEYYFLRARQINGRASVVMRVNEGLSYNYWELYFHQTPQGLKIEDFFLFNAGMPHSENTAFIFYNAFFKNAGVIQKILGKQKAYQEELQKLFLAQKKYMGGEPEEAVALLDAIKPPAKDSRFAMTLALAVFSNEDEDRFLKAVDYYSTIYPDHPSLKMYTIRVGLLRGQLEKTMKAIEALDQAVGGDFYLQTEVSAVLISKKDLSGAAKALNLADKAPGSAEQVAGCRVSLYLAQENYPEVVRTLNLLENRFGYYFQEDVFDEDEEYSGFLKSEAYAEWTKQRAEADPEQE